MSDAHRLSTPRGLALARMLATVPRSARLGHSSALPPPSCSLISPLLSAACAQPRPPRTAGRARCHRRSLLRPRRHRAVAGRRRLRPPVRVWPSHLGLPPAQPSSPMDACGPTGARAALLLGSPPPALACRGWPWSQPPAHVAGRPWATSGGATTGFGCASTPRSSSAASSPPSAPSRPTSRVPGDPPPLPL